ncbi:MAG TPA: MBL fold metallo-hydrolase [Gaiellaceae bacterium]|nr:MBL fold metallo-hydrolase [Gaiellaceae bacterium]
MRATIWGCRGSLATPGEPTIRYGGNTTSVEVRTASGRIVVLDAGTGIRLLGLALRDERPSRIDLILTHLHLDHVEGLGFFAPLFDPECAITIWGPHQNGSSLRDRVAAYLSPPLFPLPFAEFGSRIEFRELGAESWQLDGLNLTAAPVKHPGSTLGYRLKEDDRVFAFIPDNELGLEPESGLALAERADVLFHDAQYTPEEYRKRHGWGHTSIEDLPRFLTAADPALTVMFHHDPTHADAVLEEMHERVRELTGRKIELAAERSSYDL